MVAPDTTGVTWRELRLLRAARDVEDEPTQGEYLQMVVGDGEQPPSWALPGAAVGSKPDINQYHQEPKRETWACACSGEACAVADFRIKMKASTFGNTSMGGKRKGGGEGAALGMSRRTNNLSLESA